MAKYSEDQLTSWTKPPSDSEESKLENSERIVKEAINSDEKLSSRSIEIFGQGSYANNTNVRLNSDIDINVRNTSDFYFDLPKGKERSDFGLDSPSDYSFREYKNDVEQALVRKFGRDEVIRKNKCITVKGNSYRVETDVVPTWNYRRYREDGTYVLGAQFISDDGKWVTNYPKQHIENGINKNNATSRRFKRLTRLQKKLWYKMKEEEFVSDTISSFLIECLIWNVPNNLFNNYDTWEERLKQSIVYIYDNTKEEETCKEWGEVSELLYLFVGRKWTYKDVNTYMIQLWNYLNF